MISTLVCKHCLTKLDCVSPCTARMFYIVHYIQGVNRACVHLGVHNHHVAQLVREEVQRIPHAKILAIALVVEKTRMSIEIMGDEKHDVEILMRKAKPISCLHLGQLCLLMFATMLHFSSLNMHRMTTLIIFQSSSAQARWTTSRIAPYVGKVISCVPLQDEQYWSCFGVDLIKQPKGNC